MANPWLGLEQALGREIQHRRLQAGASQDELAASAGVTRNYVSELERGLKSPTLRTLSGLASALGVAPHVLLSAAEGRLSDQPEE